MRTRKEIESDLEVVRRQIDLLAYRIVGNARALLWGFDGNLPLESSVESIRENLAKVDGFRARERALCEEMIALRPNAAV